MREDFLRAAGLPEDMFLSPGPSHQEIGRVTSSAAAQTGLRAGTPVFCGGVDNACMAMGAAGAEEGRSYISLGSSAWVPVNCKKPVLDFDTRPYTFAHLQEGMYTSAYSLFAGGNSLRWARDVLFPDLDKETAYQEMDRLAAAEPLGAGGVLFHPGLAGGTMQDPSPNLRGAFMNLQLGTSRAGLLRAVMEGVAMNLALSLGLLRERCQVKEPVLFCGGGSKSPVSWCDLLNDPSDFNKRFTSGARLFKDYPLKPALARPSGHANHRLCGGQQGQRGVPRGHYAKASAVLEHLHISNGTQAEFHGDAASLLCGEEGVLGVLSGGQAQFNRIHLTHLVPSILQNTHVRDMTFVLSGVTYT